MHATAVSHLLRKLRSRLTPTSTHHATDAVLLGRFVDSRDEAAFETMVLRHGPMVLGVCRRVLGHEEDAEDAFQATFLVLAQKARSIHPPQALARWLHGVAHNVSLKARVASARRHAREDRSQLHSSHDLPQDWFETREILDQEVSKLPDDYRLPLVLCDLEGLTRTEASFQLGWPEGTVAGRLARARDLLASRLTRRGVALSAGALSLVFAHEAALASPSMPLVSATLKSALLSGASSKVAALASGIVKSALVTRLQYAALVLLACTLAGFGWFAYRAAADGGQGKEQAALAQVKPPAADRPRIDIKDLKPAVAQAGPRGHDEAKSELDRMQGSWRVVSSQVGDEKASPEEVKKRKVTVKGDVLTYYYGNELNEKRKGTLKLDPKTKYLDWNVTFPEAGSMLALYELNGDDLKIGFGNDGQVRPGRWAIGKDDVVWQLVLKRETVPLSVIVLIDANTKGVAKGVRIKQIEILKEAGGKRTLDQVKHENGKPEPRLNGIFVVHDAKITFQDDAVLDRQILVAIETGKRILRDVKYVHAVSDKAGGTWYGYTAVFDIPAPYDDDLEVLQGTWRGVKGTGSPKTDDRAKNITFVLKGNKMTMTDSNPDQKTTTVGTVKLDPKTRAFDWMIDEKSGWAGIYDFNDDEFKFYVVPRIVGVAEVPRPKSFDDKPVGVQLFVLKREKP